MATNNYWDYGLDPTTGKIALGPYAGLTHEEARTAYARDAKRKKQEEFNRKNVTGVTNKVAEDYLVPAAKTAASFTPYGPIIGAMDAYEAWDRGEKGTAIALAGLEALPYGAPWLGKMAGKGARAVLNHSDTALDAVSAAVDGVEALKHSKAVNAASEAASKVKNSKAGRFVSDFWNEVDDVPVRSEHREVPLERMEDVPVGNVPLERMEDVPVGNVPLERIDDGFEYIPPDIADNLAGDIADDPIFDIYGLPKNKKMSVHSYGNSADDVEQVERLRNLANDVIRDFKSPEMKRSLQRLRLSDTESAMPWYERIREVNQHVKRSNDLLDSHTFVTVGRPGEVGRHFSGDYIEDGTHGVEAFLQDTARAYDEGVKLGSGGRSITGHNLTVYPTDVVKKKKDIDLKGTIMHELIHATDTDLLMGRQATRGMNSGERADMMKYLNLPESLYNPDSVDRELGAIMAGTKYRGQERFGYKFGDRIEENLNRRIASSRLQKKILEDGTPVFDDPRMDPSIHPMGKRVLKMTRYMPSAAAATLGAIGIKNYMEDPENTQY